MLAWINLVHIALQDTRCIIHRTTLQTSERQYSGMESLVACERLILSVAFFVHAMSDVLAICAGG